MNVRRWWLGPTLVLAVGLLATVAVWLLLARPAPPRETVAASDAVHAVTAAWPDLGSLTFPEELTRVTVVDGEARLLAHVGDPFRTDADAYSAGAGAFALVVDGERVGTLYALDRSEGARSAAARTASVLATAGIALAVAATWGYAALQYRSVVRPFRRLERFATDVARGDLDTPLPMDRANTFGAFSEAFDLMRSELAAAQEREEAAHQNARRLVSELSHDIRTPVSSIAATAEVLGIRSQEEATRASAEVILQKAGQIQALVADLVSANEVAIESLPVNLGEWSARDLEALIRSCDVAGSVRAEPLPECLVTYDPLRMRQVVDNILINAAKYAGGEVELGAAVAEEFLVLRFRDHGPGVPADELDAILGRGVRG
ncbi:MAG: HAMP domain-containing sensor histidine kinase, partial [bacterium]|nr:HAMP domain-containing sensor histidine kinase [bacterium]